MTKTEPMCYLPDEPLSHEQIARVIGATWWHVLNADGKRCGYAMRLADHPRPCCAKMLGPDTSFEIIPSNFAHGYHWDRSFADKEMGQFYAMDYDNT